MTTGSRIHELERLTMGFTTFTTKRTKLTKTINRLANLSFNYKATITNHRDALTSFSPFRQLKKTIKIAIFCRQPSTIPMNLSLHLRLKNACKADRVTCFYSNDEYVLQYCQIEPNAFLCIYLRS